MSRDPFVLTREEVKALFDLLFNRVGYISYDTDYPVIELIRRLRFYIEDLPEEYNKEKND